MVEDRSNFPKETENSRVYHVQSTPGWLFIHIHKKTCEYVRIGISHRIFMQFKVLLQNATERQGVFA